MTSPNDPWETQRPRDRMYLFAIDRIHVLQDFAKRHCRVVNCGERDEDGVIICGGDGCGEKLLHADHRRELRIMRDVKRLVERLEQNELEAAALADKESRGRRR